MHTKPIMVMTDQELIAREKELQSQLRIQPTLNLEFKALISRLFREHNIEIAPDVLSKLTLALDRTAAEEPRPIDASLASVDTSQDSGFGLEPHHIG